MAKGKSLYVRAIFAISTDTDEELDEAIDTLGEEMEYVAQHALRSIGKHGRHRHAHTRIEFEEMDF